MVLGYMPKGNKPYNVGQKPYIIGLAPPYIRGNLSASPICMGGNFSDSKLFQPYPVETK